MKRIQVHTPPGTWEYKWSLSATQNRAEGFVNTLLQDKRLSDRSAGWVHGCSERGTWAAMSPLLTQGSELWHLEVGKREYETSPSFYAETRSRHRRCSLWWQCQWSKVSATRPSGIRSSLKSRENVGVAYHPSVMVLLSLYERFFWTVSAGRWVCNRSRRMLSILFRPSTEERSELLFRQALSVIRNHSHDNRAAKGNPRQEPPPHYFPWRCQSVITSSITRSDDKENVQVSIETS